MPSYDPTCYLCPGNARAPGQDGKEHRNAAYTDTYAFDNDFAALVPGRPPGTLELGELFQATVESGICRVICFSPRHDLTLADMEVAAIRRVVDLWVDEYRRLGRVEGIRHVQIFENKGEMMGCSNPHPHGQIWAQSAIPIETAKEARRLTSHFERHGRTLLEDYLANEIRLEERLVTANDSFVALVPFWALWPFETLVVSRRAVPHLHALTDGERQDLADIIKRVTVKYDNLFGVSCPYSSGVHQAPTDGLRHPEWHLHLHFYPPLLRSATVKKFLVGYEMMAEPQRDLTPELAAQRLRELSETKDPTKRK